MTIARSESGNVTLVQENVPAFMTDAEITADKRSRMVVSRFQALQALDNAGLLATAEAIVADGSATTQRAWSEAIEFRRTSPTITSLGSVLFPVDTDTELDGLFEAAALIEA